MPAYLVGRAVFGGPTDIHTSALNVVGSESPGFNSDGYPCIYKYLKGIGSTIAGSVVTYDEAGNTALIAANAIGPVAVAQAATVANTWGWYMVSGVCLVDTVANSADNGRLGRETTDGKVGDGRAAGDEIYNFVGRTATTSAALAAAQFHYPFVDDVNGA